MRKFMAGWLSALLMLGLAAFAEDNSGSGMAAAASGNDIVAVCTADTTMAMFVKHVNKAGIAEELQGAGPFTVFAPDNSGFNARSQKDMDAEHKDPAVLLSTMKYHVLNGQKLTAADLMKMDGQTLTMDNGMKLSIRVHGNRIMIGKAHILKSDWTASNGVIHVIDKVEIPGKETLAAKTPSRHKK